MASVIDKTLAAGSSAFTAGTNALAVIGGNISNLNTVGYKSSNALMTDAFYETLQQSSASTGSAGSNMPSIQIGGGTTLSAIVRNFNQGSLQNSGGLANLAIEGNGFFQVVDSLNQDVFATRDGSFRTDAKGYIVNQAGFRLQGSRNDPNFEPQYTASYDTTSGKLVFTQNSISGTPAAPTINDMSTSYKLASGSNLTITRQPGSTPVPGAVPSTFTDAQVEAMAPRLQSFTFNAQGQLQIMLSDGNAFVRGQLLLMSFNDPQGLMSQSGGLYNGFDSAGSIGFTTSGNVPGTGGLGVIHQGKLESSNVDLTSEFANIIGAQKFVQANGKVMMTAQDVLDVVVNLKR